MTPADLQERYEPIRSRSDNMEEYILKGRDGQIEIRTDTPRPNVSITGADVRWESWDVMGTDPDGET